MVSFFGKENLVLALKEWSNGNGTMRNDNSDLQVARRDKRKAWIKPHKIPSFSFYDDESGWNRVEKDKQRQRIKFYWV